MNQFSKSENSFEEEELKNGKGDASDEQKQKQFQPFKQFKENKGEQFHQKEIFEQNSEIRPPTITSMDRCILPGISERKLSRGNLKQNVDLKEADKYNNYQAKSINEIHDIFLIPKDEEPEKQIENFESQKIGDILQKRHSKLSMNFIQLLLTKRMINNFKDNLLTRAYIWPKKMSNHLKKLLEENYVKKKDKSSEKQRVQQQQNQNSKLQKSLTQFLILGYFFDLYLLGNKIQKNKFRFPVFDPTNKMIIFWESIKISLIILFFWWVPFQLSFQVELSEEVKKFQIYQLIFFLIDIIIKLNKAYLKQGLIIRERKEILIHYFLSEALVDLLSLMCIIIYSQWMEELNRFIIFLLLIIYFLLNISKINRSLQKISETFAFQGVFYECLSLAKLILIIYFFAHIIACVWFFVGQFFVDLFFINRVNSSNLGITWITANNLQNADIWTLYNYSFYWATLTMVTVGYGDITPKNNYELICANLTMFVACGVFAFSINAIGIVLQNMNEGKKKLKRTMSLINHYMNRNQVNFELQSRVRNYLEYCYEQENEMDDQEVKQHIYIYLKIGELIGKLSQNLKQDLLFGVLSKVLKNLKTLKSQLPVKWNLSDLALMKIFFRKQNQIDDDSLFIIQKGEVRIFEEKSKKIFKILKVFCFKARVSASLAFSQVLSEIAQRQARDLLEYIRSQGIICFQLYLKRKMTRIKETFHFIKDKLIYQQKYEAANLKCFACGKSTHLVTECKNLLYIPDLERLIKKELFCDFQDKQQFYRKFKKSRVNHSLAFLKIIQEESKIFAESESESVSINSEEGEEQVDSVITITETENEKSSEGKKDKKDKNYVDSKEVKDVSGSQLMLHLHKIYEEKKEKEEEHSPELKLSQFAHSDLQAPIEEFTKVQKGIRNSQEKKTYVNDKNKAVSKFRGSLQGERKSCPKNTANQEHELNEDSIENKSEEQIRRKSVKRVTNIARPPSILTTKQFTERHSIMNGQSQLANEEEEDESINNISFNLDQLQSFKIYYPLANVDVVCKKLQKLQKTFTSKKTSIMQKERSKYTFYFLVKKQANKLRNSSKLSKIPKNQDIRKQVVKLKKIADESSSSRKIKLKLDECDNQNQ